MAAGSHPKSNGNDRNKLFQKCNLDTVHPNQCVHFLFDFRDEKKLSCFKHVWITPDLSSAPEWEGLPLMFFACYNTGKEMSK